MILFLLVMSTGVDHVKKYLAIPIFLIFAGGLALKGVKGGKLAKDLSKLLSDDFAARKEAAERVAKEMAEKAAQEAESKIAEAGSEKIGTKIAETTIGAGITGAVAKQNIISCPHCGEKLPSDSEYCSKCGQAL